MGRKLQILGHSLSEMDLIIHILYNLPEEYSTTVEMIENDFELDLATLERVKEKLRIKFERINQLRVEHGKALFNREKQKKYKGLCS
jgi:gag-polypeptide of LTR copia-type